jgi:hypothetical protein
MAQDRVARTSQLTTALTEEPGGLEVLAGRALPPVRSTVTAGNALAVQEAIRIVAPSAGTSIALRSLIPLPLSRPRLPEVLRQDDPSRIAAIGRIIIIIPRP